jgi:tetratricopeptide (TPR) repeat protein
MTFVFDCHDESYFEWRDAGLRSCTLVHVDAHHDMEPASPSGAIDIGNYVRAAIRDGIVARMCWVVPDPMWDAADQRERLLGELRNAAPAVDVQITPLADLATVEAPVLLDIDLDFLFTARFDRDPALGVLHDPWLWPDALVDALATRCRRRAMTTIATSVTGAFTPLAWKSLAAELAARMDGLPIDRDVAQAAREFRQAERDMRAGRQDDARAAFRRAVAVDPGYRHPFRTLGHHRLGDGRVAEAAECFASALALDPDDHWAKLGLAVIALDAGRPRDADALLTDIPADLDSIDCLRARARTLAAIGNAEDAIAAYRRVLKAALVGAVPLSVWTSNRDRHLVDPGHWRDHAALAALCERAGDAASASAHRRIAAAAGVTGIG